MILCSICGKPTNKSVCGGCLMNSAGVTAQPDKRENKYARAITKKAECEDGTARTATMTVDFYDIARAFGVTDPAIAHALKKLLRYGCGTKPLAKDVDEAIFSLTRWQEDQRP